MDRRGARRPPRCLLSVDMINPFTFPNAEHMFPAIVATAARIQALKRRAHAEGVPTIYVNDNFGTWRNDFRTLVERVMRKLVEGVLWRRFYNPGLKIISY